VEPAHGAFVWDLPLVVYAVISVIALGLALYLVYRHPGMSLIMKVTFIAVVLFAIWIAGQGAYAI